MRPFVIAGVVFGVYLLMVALIGSLALSVASATLLFIVVLMASSSTIDSSASGLQYTFRRWPGIVLGAGLAIAWPFLAEMGILNLWASQGFIIISLAITVFVLAALRRRGLQGRLVEKSAHRSELA